MTRKFFADLRRQWMGALALLLVLTGGAAYAAQKIGPKDIRKNAVRAKHIKGNQVNGKHVKEQALSATPLRTRAAQGGCEPTVPGTGQMVEVGSVCIDRYEASVWSRPNGGVQYGVNGDDYPCNDNGQNCGDIYARSVPGVPPSGDMTWFQAQEALVNSGKRLPTNAEWQAAVAGTPDGAPCNVDAPGRQLTGASPVCRSRHGVNDMVGNLWEWVADWMPRATCTASWPAGYGSDFQAICGAATDGGPGALLRGGYWANVTIAGRFAVWAGVQPSTSGEIIGFRGAR